MIKLTVISQAISLISSLFTKNTPKVGEDIINGAKEISKIGHLLNGVSAAVITGIAYSDFELLYSWWEKDKVFFVIVVGIMQAPYVISVYMKAIGKGQAEDVQPE